jgi:MFS-type transporter involved in bile tolerance (Atg22 family)
MYYLYAIFPVYFWREAIQKRHIFFSVLSGNTSHHGWSIIKLALLLVIGLELLVRNRDSIEKDNIDTL